MHQQRIALISDLMKQTGELSLTSEMAVSLVQSHPAPPMKRSADDMLLDNHLRLPSNPAPISPLAYAHSPVSIVTQSPFKLPESYLSPISLENTSPQNRLHSSNSPRDESASTENLPIVKRVKLDEIFTRQGDINQSMQTPDKRMDMLKPMSAMLSPRPYSWLENNTSPSRQSDVSDAAQSLLCPGDVLQAAMKQGEGAATRESANTARVLAAVMQREGAAAREGAETARVLAPPLVIKPHIMGSPSRSSDGELGAENDADDAHEVSHGERTYAQCPFTLM